MKSVPPRGKRVGPSALSLGYRSGGLHASTISAINTTMSTQELIMKEVENLPEQLQREVYDFARFLRETSADESFNGVLLSESVLRKDWDTPEEDAAWANL
jgi:hypothetical protein